MRKSTADMGSGVGSLAIALGVWLQLDKEGDGGSGNDAQLKNVAAHRTKTGGNGA